MRAFTAVVIVLGIGTSLPADNTPAATPDQSEFEAKIQEMAKVGWHHEYFNQMVGTWDTMSTDYSGEEPTVSKGTAAFELQMDGRFLKQTFESEFNGKPFQGMGLTGYDNVQKKYVGTWIDNVGTGMMRYEGSLDMKTGVMTDIGEVVTPVGPMKFKMVTEHPANDRILFTMYMLAPDGDETKHMTIEYVRHPDSFKFDQF